MKIAPHVAAGYRTLTESELLALVRHLALPVWDCRSSAVKRPALRKLPGYVYKGDRYGGRMEISDVDVAVLADAPPVLLLCACDAPGDCHLARLSRRLVAIERDVDHLFSLEEGGDVVVFERIRAQDLHRSIDFDRAYSSVELRIPVEVV